jgi:hypothetical protein
LRRRDRTLVGQRVENRVTRRVVQNETVGCAVLDVVRGRGKHDRGSSRRKHGHDGGRADDEILPGGEARRGVAQGHPAILLRVVTVDQDQHQRREILWRSLRVVDLDELVEIGSRLIVIDLVDHERGCCRAASTAVDHPGPRGGLPRRALALVIAGGDEEPLQAPRLRMLHDGTGRGVLE